MSTAPELPADQVFENPKPRGGSASLLFLGGVGLIALAIVGFVVAIRTRHGQMSMHLTTTLPTIAAVGMLARGFSLRNTPRRIVVGPDALEITDGRGSRRHPWSEIGSAATANVLNSPKTCLRITDTSGKTLVKVDESFPEFRRLVTLVESAIDGKPDDTAARLMARKARRTGLLMFAFGGCFALGSVFVAIKTREEQRGRELLARSGVPGEGEIVRRFVAPNGVTKRLEYRVAGSAVRNVEVHPAFWDQLEQAKTVAVVYVPGEPDVSRLLVGEVEGDQFSRTPGGGYLPAALGGLMALFFLAFGPIAWMGYDLAFDDERRAWKVKRHGRVIWASKRGVAGPLPRP